MRFTGLVAVAAAGFMAVSVQAHVPTVAHQGLVAARAVEVAAPAAGAGLEARQYSGPGSLGGQSRLLNYLHCLLFDILNAQAKNLPPLLQALRNTLTALGTNPPTPAVEQAIAADLLAIRNELEDTIKAILGIRSRPRPSQGQRCSTLEALSNLLTVTLREIATTLRFLENNPLVQSRFSPELERLQSDIEQLLWQVDMLQVRGLASLGRAIAELEEAFQRAGLDGLNIPLYALGLP